VAVAEGRAWNCGNPATTPDLSGDRRSKVVLHIDGKRVYQGLAPIVPRYVRVNWFRVFLAKQRRGEIALAVEGMLPGTHCEVLGNFPK
jgi:hypothetical protein